MLKTKLFATICAVASAVTVATTALTLSIAGPSGLQTIHSLNANDAIATGITNVFNSAKENATELTEVIDVITSNKTSANVGFTINSLIDNEELNGMGGELEIQVDSKTQAAALLLEAKLGEMGLFNGTIYVDKNEILTSVPFLFDGVLQAGLDNLTEDLTNSYIGNMLLGDADIDELKNTFDTILSQYETMKPDFDFDSEKFADGLKDVINTGFDNTMANMDTEDLGMVKLNGGSYQCYSAKVPVAELSYIFRDAIKYVLESKDFQSFVDQLIAYAEETVGEDLVSEDEFSGAMLGQLSAMVDLYWTQVITSVELILGTEIEFVVYLTETVEIAGIEFDAYVLDERLSYDAADASKADGALVIKADFTGGKEIGDYKDVDIEIIEASSPVATIDYTAKQEENGDFTMKLNAEADSEVISLTADGNYVEKGDFFSLTVDSIKLLLDNELLFDFGFSLGFNAIDSIAKPSATPVYDIWEMDEADFEALLTEMAEKLEALGLIDSSDIEDLLSGSYDDFDDYDDSDF